MKFFFLIFFLSAISFLSGAEKGSFEKIESLHFVIFHRPADKKIALHLLSWAEEAYQELKADFFSFSFKNKVKIYLYPGLKNFKPTWIVARARGKKNQIFLKSPRRLPFTNLQKLLKHELVHIFLSKLPIRLPLWFNEGMAMWLAKEWQLNYSFTLMQAVLAKKVLPFDSLVFTFPLKSKKLCHLAYIQSLNFICFLARTFGRGKIKALIAEFQRPTKFDQAVYKIFKKDLYSLQQEWLASLSQKYYRLTIYTSVSFLWIMITFLFIFVYWRKRRISQAKQLAWEEEESNWEEVK